jgi:hypothetical protein
VKRIIKILLAVVMVLTLVIIPAIPVGANDSNIYESFLSDNPAPACPDILNYGKVTINSEFIAQIEILTNAIDKTYGVIMEVGGIKHRYNVNLGTITTNGKGKGEARIDLKDYDGQITTRRVISPYFVIVTPGKPEPEFDTSYLVFADADPPEPGQIIVVAQNSPVTGDEHVGIDMSYGGRIGYPNGLVMYNGDQILSGPLMPGIYTVTENVGSTYILESIDINDPSGDSFPCGRTAIINLKPGETVTVTFNSQMFVKVDLFDLRPEPDVKVGNINLTVFEDQGTKLVVWAYMVNGEPNLLNWDVIVSVKYTPQSELPPDLVQVFNDVLTTDEFGNGSAMVDLNINPPSGTETIKISIDISEDGIPPAIFRSYVQLVDW